MPHLQLRELTIFLVARQLLRLICLVRAQIKRLLYAQIRPLYKQATSLLFQLGLQAAVADLALTRAFYSYSIVLQSYIDRIALYSLEGQKCEVVVQRLLQGQIACIITLYKLQDLAQQSRRLSRQLARLLRQRLSRGTLSLVIIARLGIVIQALLTRQA